MNKSPTHNVGGGVKNNRQYTIGSLAKMNPKQLIYKPGFGAGGGIRTLESLSYVTPSLARAQPIREEQRRRRAVDGLKEVSSYSSMNVDKGLKDLFK